MEKSQEKCEGVYKQRDIKALPEIKMCYEAEVLYFGVRVEVEIQSLEINPNKLWKFRICRRWHFT